MDCENRFCVELENDGSCNKCIGAVGFNNLCGRRALYLRYINDGYRALVRRWTQQAQSSVNTDDERLVYERCAMSLHELNIQVERD